MNSNSNSSTLSPQMPLLSYLDVITCRQSGPAGFRHLMGRPNSCFCLLTRGSVTVYSAQGETHAHGGQLVFWPESVPYRSVWSGEEDSEYIGIYFRLVGRSGVHSGSVKSTQLVSCNQFVVMPGMDYLSRFQTIHADYYDKDRASLALAGFYQLYHDLIPLLPTGKRMHPVIQRAQSFMEQNWEDDFRITELSAFCQISESRLYHIFKEETLLSPVEYKNQVRIRHAADLLLSEDASVEWISDRMHFSSPSYFRRVFRKYTGMTPSAYRKSGGLTPL